MQGHSVSYFLKIYCAAGINYSFFINKVCALLKENIVYVCSDKRLDGRTDALFWVYFCFINFFLCKIILYLLEIMRTESRPFICCKFL